MPTTGRFRCRTDTERSGQCGGIGAPSGSSGARPSPGDHLRRRQHRRDAGGDRGTTGPLPPGDHPGAPVAGAAWRRAGRGCRTRTADRPGAVGVCNGRGPSAPARGAATDARGSRAGHSGSRRGESILRWWRGEKFRPPSLLGFAGLDPACPVVISEPTAQCD